MIFELTQDYQILVPLMITNMLSFMISRRFQPKPVYHALLEQNHIYLPGPETRFSAGSWRARDIMTRDVAFIPEHESIQTAANVIGERNRMRFS
jgi:CIC family chloride channel protein